MYFAIYLDLAQLPKNHLINELTKICLRMTELTTTERIGLVELEAEIDRLWKMHNDVMKRQTLNRPSIRNESKTPTSSNE
jgi:hypothetical protein